MTAEQLFDNYTSKRDYSGSLEDEYAQLLWTIRFAVGDAILPLLEKAEINNKKLSIIEDNSFEFAPQLTIEQISIV